MSKIIMITGPSGVGKGTIEKELFKDESLNIDFSVSATTRTKREGEINGKHYHFISKSEFEKLIKEDAFLEYSQHFNNYYGTPYKEVFDKINDGKNVLVEVETNGAVNIIKRLKEKNKDDLLISIFIVPPSIDILKDRIIKRNSENEESLNDRLKRAKEELSYTKYFKHIVENDNLESAVKTIKEIIKRG